MVQCRQPVWKLIMYVSWSTRVDTFMIAQIRTTLTENVRENLKSGCWPVLCAQFFVVVFIGFSLPWLTPPYRFAAVCFDNDPPRLFLVAFFSSHTSTAAVAIVSSGRRNRGRLRGGYSLTLVFFLFCLALTAPRHFFYDLLWQRPTILLDSVLTTLQCWLL